MTRRHPHLASRWLTACLGALLALSLEGQADALRLSDLWLEQPALPESPAYSYYLLEGQQEPQQRQARRLQEELATLIDGYSLAGHARLAQGLGEWQASIAALQEMPGRTAARADLAALLASPRHDPLLATLAEVGHCAVPEWVELWHFGGVTRHRWRPGLSLRHLLREQPNSHWTSADEAWVITPQGTPRRIGVAAWNAGDAPLVAGSRVALVLPEPALEADWVNRALPGFLATRLPGDACHAVALPEADRVDSGGPAT